MDLQSTLEEFYKSDLRCQELANEIKEKFYRTVEDYINNKQEVKYEITKMLERHHQLVLVNSNDHQHQRNKTPEQIKEQEERRRILDKVRHLYNKIGKLAYGDDFFNISGLTNPSSKKSTPTTNPTDSISNSPTAIPFNLSDLEEALETLDECNSPTSEPTSITAGTGSVFKVDNKVAIPKKKNPYYELTHFLVNTFILLIVGQSGSGKTTFVGHLINAFNPIGSIKTYDRIWYIIPEGCPKCEVMLTLQLNYEVLIFEGLENMPELPTDNADGTLLIIFDDMLGVPDKNRRIESCFKMGRRVCSLIFIAQSYFKVEKFYRDNMYYLAMLPPMLPKDTKAVMDNVGGGLETEILQDIFRIGTTQTYVPLMIDVRSTIDRRFRQGLTGNIIVVPSPLSHFPLTVGKSMVKNRDLKKNTSNNTVYTVDSDEDENTKVGEKDEFYYLEQTPRDLAKDLLAKLPLEVGDCLLEPFKGEGNFYDQFPDNCPKDWCEIELGCDFRKKSWELRMPRVDWVITNPPFRIDDDKGNLVNAFYFALDFFSHVALKGIAFLGNDSCLATLTPNRLKELASRQWYLNQLQIISVKAWRGRYYWIVFGRTTNPILGFLEKNYE